MAAPVWITKAGSLGKIQEAEFYDFQLVARDPDVSDPDSEAPGITFTLQSGKLPTGIRLTRSGKCEGLPSCEVFVSGVPTNVGQSVTSKFVVRATSSDGIVDDRTFELTVVGQDDPILLTQQGLLGTYRDGDYVNTQIMATDADPSDSLTFKLLSGQLPPGLTVTSNGYIQGYIEPIPTETGTPGFDATPFDTNTFDFRTIAQNKNFQFTISVTDGKSVVAGTYTIFVYAGNVFTADTTILSADMDNSPLTADQTALRVPALLTPEQSLGIIRHDNYFAYKFEGIDFDGDPLEYSIGVGPSQGFDNDLGFDSEINGFDQGNLELPPGLLLDETTGWLYGYIPNQSSTQTEYTFTVRVSKAQDSSYRSEWKFFTMTIVGDIASVVTWNTPQDLGTIRVGEISALAIESTNTLNKPVQYRIKSGSTSKLPQGLKLSSDGLILGRPAFKTMMFDGGTTTFDSDSMILNETTFDRTFSFTVEVYDAEGDISTTRIFTIKVDPGMYKPYENLWVKAYPKVTQRSIWESLINSLDDFPPELIYRQNDYYYGKQNDIRFIVSTGLSPSTPSEMIQAMAKNHYNKRVALGEIKKARAVKNNEVQYEVVYAEVLDTESNSSGKSTSLSIDFYENHNQIWSNPALVSETDFSADENYIQSSDTDQHIFFPNSFKNMNQRMLNNIGQLELSSLPLWMQSKQEDGTILGFIPAVVIAYVVPGAADEIIFNIKRRTDIDLKKIEFIIDRYIWDNDMTVNYNTTTNSWISSVETTFDIEDGIPNQTVFEGDRTRFIQNSFQYKENKDSGDQFLKFRKENIKV